MGSDNPRPVEIMVAPFCFILFVVAQMDARADAGADSQPERPPVTAAETAQDAARREAVREPSPALTESRRRAELTFNYTSAKLQNATRQLEYFKKTGPQFQIDKWQREVDAWQVKKNAAADWLKSLGGKNKDRPRDAFDDESRAAFHARYRLNEGEALKFIPKPFIRERAQFWAANYGKRFKNNPLMSAPPETAFFHWNEDNTLGKVYGRSRGARSVNSACRFVLQLLSYEYRGLYHEGVAPGLILRPPDRLPGDWIVRKEAPMEDKLRDLTRELKRHFGRDVRFEKRLEEREILVVKGEYNFTPLPGDYRQPFVHLMSDESEAQGGHSGATLDELVRALGDITETPVVNAAKSAEGKTLHFVYYRSGYLRNAENPNERLRMRRLLLKNFTRQTGLKIKSEIREVAVWHASEAPGPGKPMPVDRQTAQ